MALIVVDMFFKSSKSPLINGFVFRGVSLPWVYLLTLSQQVIETFMSNS
jgi:hypothetical protein